LGEEDNGCFQWEEAERLVRPAGMTVPAGVHLFRMKLLSRVDPEAVGKHREHSRAESDNKSRDMTHFVP
jgi:hypothetical protein